MGRSIKRTFEALNEQIAQARSRRDAEVLRRVGAGEAKRAVARDLGISRQAVYGILERARRKER